MRKLIVVVVLTTMILTVVGASPATAAPVKADFVFIIDATSSMAGEIAGVRNGLNTFVGNVAASGIDARYAIVIFGGEAELAQDFQNAAITQANFAKVQIGPSAGFHNNHNFNPEAGLEAIRQVLGVAPVGLVRNNLGGVGDLVFRADARKNLMLFTDEDSDLPFHVANRFPGQAGNPPAFPNAIWQQEVDATAQAVIGADAFLNMLINRGDVPSVDQYGDWAFDVSDADLLNFDAAATLAALQLAGLGDSLQAQVLAAGLIGRTFDIAGANNPTFVDNFFAAKVQEVVQDVIPEPGTLILFGLGALGGLFVTVRRRRRA